MRHVLLCSALVACGAAGFSPRAVAQDARRPETHSGTFTVVEPLINCIRIVGDTLKEKGYEIEAPPDASPPPLSRLPSYVTIGRAARAVALVVCIPIDPNRTSVTVSAFSSHPKAAETEFSRLAEPFSHRRVVGPAIRGKIPEAKGPAVQEATLMKNEPSQRTLRLAREALTQPGFKLDDAGDSVVTGGTPAVLVRVICVPIGGKKTYATVVALSSDSKVAELARDNVRHIVSQVGIDGP
jgi:hypothetical protein